LAGLYRKQGPYWYAGGFNWRAIAALVAGILPCGPGFLAQVGLANFSPIWTELYSYAWFISLGIASAVYLALMLASPLKSTTATAN
jgi:NCS1 family nucleobase:cation symporter-1